MRRLAIAIMLLMTFSGYCQESKVTATKVGDHIDVVIDGIFFTSYHFSDSEKYPYFFPVNGLSEASVTSMRNGVYPHHTSLWFGCDMVNGGNYWQEGLERGCIISTGATIKESGAERVVIEDECIWKRPDAQSPITDRRVITISRPHSDYYQIDFDITLRMQMDVEILKTNHSLFSARIDPDLAVRRGGTMVNAEGEMGEKENFGKPSPWISCYGMREGFGTEGITILQHPSCYGYPSEWFTRDYGFISPTPMYWPKDDISTKFKDGEQISYRYRVIIHKGDCKEVGIDKLFESYSKE